MAVRRKKTKRALSKAIKRAGIGAIRGAIAKKPRATKTGSVVTRRIGAPIKARIKARVSLEKEKAKEFSQREGESIPALKKRLAKKRLLKKRKKVELIGGVPKGEKARQEFFMSGKKPHSIRVGKTFISNPIRKRKRK